MNEPQTTPAEPPRFAVEAAIAAARRSGCQKSRRGVVLWDARNIVAITGTNRPVIGRCDGSEACRRDCGRICIHAEQTVLIGPVHALEPSMLHVKVDEAGELVPSGPPSCPECSKLILASGVSEMWLFEEQAGGPRWVRYTAEDFHIQTLRHCGLHRVVAGEILQGGRAHG